MFSLHCSTLAASIGGILTLWHTHTAVKCTADMSFRSLVATGNMDMECYRHACHHHRHWKIKWYCAADDHVVAELRMRSAGQGHRVPAGLAGLAGAASKPQELPSRPWPPLQACGMRYMQRACRRLTQLRPQDTCGMCCTPRQRLRNGAHQLPTNAVATMHGRTPTTRLAHMLSQAVAGLPASPRWWYHDVPHPHKGQSTQHTTTNNCSCSAPQQRCAATATVQV
jgi:hypothetical protein